MNPACHQRTAVAWLCAAALLLLGFIAQHHALSHALTSAKTQMPHDPVAGHVQACELCLQLAGADAAVPPATLAVAHGASHGFDGHVAVSTCRAEAFVAYDCRAPPRHS